MNRVLCFVGVGLVAIAATRFVERNPRGINARETAPNTGASLPAGAELAFDEASKDLGVVTGQVECQFRVTNRGRQTARNITFRSSCSCQLPKLDLPCLEPGESAALAVTIDPTRAPPGGRSAAIDVDYGPEPRTARLLVYYSRELDVVAPGELLVHATNDGDASAELLVTYFRRDAPKLLAITASSDAVSADVLESGSPVNGGWNYRSHIAVRTRGLPAGHYTETVTLTTDDAKRPTIGVLLRLRVTQRVRVLPDTVRFPATAAGSAPSVRAYVEDVKGEEVAIDQLEAPDGLVIVTRTLSPARLLIEVTAQPGYKLDRPT
jgi:hypothetical protein